MKLKETEAIDSLIIINNMEESIFSWQKMKHFK